MSNVQTPHKESRKMNNQAKVSKHRNKINIQKPTLMKWSYMIYLKENSKYLIKMLIKVQRMVHQQSRISIWRKCEKIPNRNQRAE